MTDTRGTKFWLVVFAFLLLIGAYIFSTTLLKKPNEIRYSRPFLPATQLNKARLPDIARNREK